MEFRVVWTEFAQNRLKSIYTYYKKKASKKVAERLTNQIYSSVKPLTHEPFIGQSEVLLSNYKQDFRYYIIKNYKVIY